MGEPIEIEGWKVTGTEARKAVDAVGRVGASIDTGPDWLVEIYDPGRHDGGMAYVPEAVVAALLRARGWTVEEPGSHVQRLRDEHAEHMRQVKARMGLGKP